GGRVSYPTFLSWRGFLQREPPRRPDPQAPEAPPSLRAEAWKFAFTGSRCQACGTRHLPPQRVCVKCHAVDRMAPERLADVRASLARGAQSEATQFCGAGGHPFPLSADPKGTLSAIAQRLLR